MTTFHAHETARMTELDGRELASFGRRAGALAVDFAIAGALFMLLSLPAAKAAIALGLWRPRANVMLQLNFFDNWYSIVWLVLYFGLATYVGNGRTPGKRLFGIRVVSLVHERVGLWQSIERALGYGASALEFGFGFLQFFVYRNRRTVHDRIAETIVVAERARTKAPAPVAAGGVDLAGTPVAAVVPEAVATPAAAPPASLPSQAGGLPAKDRPVAR